MTWSFDVFFDLRLNKSLSKQSWGWLFETPPPSLWRHCNDVIPTRPRYPFCQGWYLWCLNEIHKTRKTLWGGQQATDNFGSLDNLFRILLSFFQHRSRNRYAVSLQNMNEIRTFPVWSCPRVIATRAHSHYWFRRSLTPDVNESIYVYVCNYRAMPIPWRKEPGHQQLWHWHISSRIFQSQHQKC